MYFGQRPQQYAQRGPPVDNVELRRKEEQRRRQQEYAQALAQQVAQREQQKQRERELDRQSAGVTNVAAYQQRGNFNSAAAPPPPPTANAEQQRGFFDGLGQNDQKSRTNFARGQRQVDHPPQWQQQQQQPPEQPNYHQQQQGRPPSAMNYAPPYGQMPQAMAHQYDAPNPWSTVNNTSQWPTPSEYYQLPPQHSLAAGREDYPAHQQFQQDRASPARDNQPAWFPPDAGSGFNTNGFGSSGPGYPSPPSPTRDPQQQQPQQFGRRVRTDINGGGENRKMQQQLELQNALQLQIEEKNRQKLEAKRKKEEEDRKEMERLAAEQRAHEFEQERLREEKRRRAEEELIRAQQAAAAVALADQKARAEQQQRFHAAQQRDDAPIRAAVPVGRVSPPKNPFVDSRAHLFQDSSVPQLLGNMSSPSIAQHPSPVSQFPANNAGYSGNQSPGNRAGSQWQQPIEHFQQQQQGARQDQGVPRYSPGRSGHAGTFHPQSQQPTAAWQSREMDRGFAGSGAPPVDPTALMRQYDDMRQELARQQQLMDQLHRAQSELQHRIQQQQQQQQENASPGRSPVPTLTDLDRLRDELREELVLREQMHRRELEALKRAHQQQQQQQEQEHRLDGGSLREQTELVPIANEQVSESERLHTKSTMLLRSTGDHLATNQTVPTAQRQQESALAVVRVGTARGSHRQSERSTPSAAPGILKSLDCDSKLVYFNGAVLHEKEVPSKPDDRGGKRVVLEPLDEDDGEEYDADPTREELSDSVDELVASSTSIRPLRLSTQSAVDESGGNQELSSSRKWIVSSNNNDQNDRSMSSPLSKSQRSPTTRSVRAAVSVKNVRVDDDWNRDDSDDALEFFVRSFPAPDRSPRYARASYQHEMMARSEIGDGAPESEATRRWPFSSQQADNSDSEEDDASMDGEQLEALFQRNVRRHEILLGFQQRASEHHADRTLAARSSVEPTRLAWTELHQQLEANREATRTDPGGRQAGRGPRPVAEPALVGSSRWMPSSLA
jgi:hypothetical protein